MASSEVQISLIASTRSRRIENRRRGSVPWFAISSSFQPAPTPNRKRPPERRSTLAACFAVTIGSRSITRQTPVPSLIRSVTPAAAISATNGSYVREYSGGSSPPAGYGVSRDAGMWVWSVKNSDSNGRSSTIRARVSGSTPSSVGK